MNEELQILQQALGDKAHWYVTAMAAVMLGIRVYRHDGVQAVLPRVAQWSTLKPWARIVIVGVASMLAALVPAVLTGQPVLAALGGAVVTALGAMAGHKVTRAAGHAQTRAALIRDVRYKPSAARRAASVIVPLDTRAIRASHDLATATDSRQRDDA